MQLVGVCLNRGLTRMTRISRIFWAVNYGKVLGFQSIQSKMRKIGREKQPRIKGNCAFMTSQRKMLL